jgi:hypothetical protein
VPPDCQAAFAPPGPIDEQYALVEALQQGLARVVYVGGFPPGDGDAVADGYPAENGEVPLPDWSASADEDLADLDAEARAAFRARDPVARARHPRPAAAHRRTPLRRARHRHRD